MQQDALEQHAELRRQIDAITEAHGKELQASKQHVDELAAKQADEVRKLEELMAEQKREADELNNSNS